MNILKSKVVILLISAVLFSSAAIGQTKITGTVADNETKEPLVEVIIVTLAVEILDYPKVYRNSSYEKKIIHLSMIM